MLTRRDDVRVGCFHVLLQPRDPQTENWSSDQKYWNKHCTPGSTKPTRTVLLGNGQSREKEGPAVKGEKTIFFTSKPSSWKRLPSVKG